MGRQQYWVCFFIYIRGYYWMNCWHCGTELIWGGDHDLDDYEDMEYDIVTNLSCPKCESYVEVYHKIEK